MACFIVPATEAIITTVATKVMESKENKADFAAMGAHDAAGNQTAHADHAATASETSTKIPFARKMKWLSNMLWGGSALLAFEHVWHGEVIAAFPFLSAATNAADTAAMLHEMATTGVTMALVVTAVWGGMLAVTHLMEKKAAEPQTEKIALASEAAAK